MQLYVIRHAQSENNALWVETGSDVGRVPDPALTDVGHQQARLLAEHLADAEPSQIAENGYDPHNRHGFGLTHLYCSLMTRSILTAQYVAQTTGLSLTAWETIHEWGGIFEYDPETEERIGLPGPNRAYFAEQFPDLVLPESVGEAGWWNRPFETRELRQARAQEFLAELLDRHGNTEDRVAIVTHAGFSYSLLQTLTQFSSHNEALDVPRRVHFTKNNTAVSRINFGDDHVNIVYTNRLQHLPAELIT